MQRGLLALRRRMLPAAAAVAIEGGNFVIVSVGTMTKASARKIKASVNDADLPEGYVQNSVMLFARVSRNFPNAESYGVITIPFLTRKDGQPVPWEHDGNANAQSLMTALGRSDVGFWSWSWQGMPQASEEDLVAVVEWARKCVREGAK